MQHVRLKGRPVNRRATPACSRAQEEWKVLAAAFNFPVEEPKRNATHWDFLLREAEWMAEDFMQVLWGLEDVFEVQHAAHQGEV